MRRAAPEINAGSMADIAFLLLIFFLVTTTMDVDSGINRRLPPYDENIDQTPPPPIRERNMFAVLVNGNDQLLVRDNYMELSQLRDAAKRFIGNFGADPTLSENPTKHVISLQNDRGTSYEMYVAVQNELAAAYTELRNEESMKRFGKIFANLAEDQQKEIADYYPQKISEAEPVNLGR